MITIEENLLYTDEGTDEVLTEAIKRVISPSVKAKLSSRKNRQAMLEKYGRDAFLLPDLLKFPVVHPDTGKPDCGLIYAARIRAKQYAGTKPGYREIAAKAEKLYKENKCDVKLHLQIHKESEEDLEIDALALVEILY